MVVDRFMRGFPEFVDKFSLKDLPMTGNDFTWSRGVVNASMSRTDRLLISSEWEILHPKSVCYFQTQSGPLPYFS